MSERHVLRKSSLGELFCRIVADGRRVLAPVRSGERVAFAEVAATRTVDLDYLRTAVSAKHAVFPACEELLRYRPAGKDVQVEAAVPPAMPTVLFGVHPCDAAAFATLEAVFTWDSPDGHFETRRAATTVVGLACTHADAYCFCTSVGGGPGDRRGSDLLFVPRDAESFVVDVLTDKGRALVSLAPQVFGPAEAQEETLPLAEVPVRFDSAGLAERLAELFDHPDAWTEASLRCLGCGACAFVCPTCSCFDIQDERDRRGGLRLRLWDSCGFSQFTLHASGHNPRTRQSERWRQRVMHKFAYQPQRLGVGGCVGCGRCARACPADMNLAEHVQALAEMRS